MCDAQNRDPQRLNFYFNAALTAFNRAKYQVQSRRVQPDTAVLSVPFSIS
ncbi:hypothetical protein J5X98_12425 [Leptothermofonsia sichuanensis E412]|nr:hypothetical protein [Leptothermofonsia sichuanensis]QZZ23065.1 hypothetical protein J5X98_12425 [Leptothermofonsia sichuanensis E412]